MKEYIELTQKREKLLHEQKAAYERLFSAAPEAKDGLKTEIANRAEELNTVTQKWESERAFEAQKARDEKAFGSLRADNAIPAAREGEQEFKTLADAIIESAQYKGWKQSGCPRLSAPLAFDLPGMSLKDYGEAAEYKTTMSTSAGFAPFVPRTGKVVLSATRRPMLADLIPQTTTPASAIKYMEETTFTNNAAATAEAASKPEAALAFTERTVNMTKIPQTIPVTDEQLEDVPQIRSIIENRLRLMHELSVENELLNGTGSSPRNFYGFLQKSGLQTQALSTDAIATALLKAITKVSYGASANVMNAEATAIVMHPTDFQSLVTVQLGTDDQRYLFGNPGMVPMDAPLKRIWGLPIVVTPVITQGTALVGDFTAHSEIFWRSGVNVDIGYANDDFLKNLQRIRVEQRLALVITRGSAFCTVTGL